MAIARTNRTGMASRTGTASRTGPPRGPVTTVLAGAVVTVLTLVLTTGCAGQGPAPRPETGEGAGASGSGDTTGRNLYRQPFAWNSPWNLPLATAASYQPFDTRAQEVYLDIEDISVDPAFPVRDFDAAGRTVPVHTDPRLSADGSYNNCASFLVDSPGGTTVAQGQPLTLDRGGNPSAEFAFPDVALTGSGLAGCHGGSALSGLGGSVRTGEMTAPGPLTHALKIGLNCGVSCSPDGGGFRWPATTADSGYQDKYGGPDPQVRMGSLMALPPDTDLSRFTRPDVRKIATALRDYGAYVVDSTGGPETNSLAAQQGAQSELPDIGSSEMVTLFRSLAVVTNNARTTPGGGALGTPRRVACAGPFADGTGGAPPGC